MTRPLKSKKQVDVHLRIRPLVKEELERQDESLLLVTSTVEDGSTSLTLTMPKTEVDDIEFVEVLGFKVPKSKPKREKTFKRFKSAQREVSNKEFFAATVAPLVNEALQGRSTCCFAYGHTGSGKTHTILGYSYEHGMYQLASERLFEALREIEDQHPTIESLDKPKLQIRFNEVYNGEVYDLLNDSAKCFVREDAHGRVQIRGETVVDAETGLVKTTSSCSQVASSHEELLEIVERGSSARTTGSSNVHRASSRSHAILEIEFVSDRILQLRNNVDQIESEYTSIRHERDTLEMDIFTRQHYKVEGKWVKKEDAKGSTNDEACRLLELRREYLKLEGQKRAAQSVVEEAQQQGLACLGGALVFVDLAGSEHAGKVSDGIQKTEKEQQECREINKSLSALKACFQAQAQGLTSTSCYRNSKLTLILRDHLRTDASHTIMIGAISPSVFHAEKTTHTLHYAQLVAEKDALVTGALTHQGPAVTAARSVQPYAYKPTLIAPMIKVYDRTSPHVDIYFYMTYSVMGAIAWTGITCNARTLMKRWKTRRFVQDASSPSLKDLKPCYSSFDVADVPGRSEGHVKSTVYCVAMAGYVEICGCLMLRSSVERCFLAFLLGSSIDTSGPIHYFMVSEDGHSVKKKIYRTFPTEFIKLKQPWEMLRSLSLNEYE